MPSEQQVGEEELPTLWGRIEEKVLQGQKLQGVDTCREILRCLLRKGLVLEGDLLRHPSNEGGFQPLSKENSFPLMSRIYRIALLGDDPRSLFSWR